MQWLLTAGPGDGRPQRESAARLDLHLQWLRDASGGDVEIADLPPTSRDPRVPPSPGYDNQPPTVSILAPRDRVRPGANIVRVRAEDGAEAIERVELLVNGERHERRSAPFDFPVTLARGLVRLTATAYDIAGLSARDVVEVQVDDYAPDTGSGYPGDDDREDPQVRIVSPRNGARVSERTTIEAEVTDDGEIEEVTLKVNGVAKQTLRQEPFGFTVTLPPGQVTVGVEARDRAGRTGRATLSLIVADPGGGLGQNDPLASRRSDVPITDRNALGQAGIDPYARQATANGGGCSVGAAAPGTELPWSFAPILLALALRRRRRRRDPASHAA